MSKMKRALSLLLAVLTVLFMLPVASSGANESADTYSIVIRYQFADGIQAAPDWTATVAAGSAISRTVPSPTIIGYRADKPAVELNVPSASKDITVVVTYSAAEVKYTVRHYLQNVDDNNYTLAETETRTGLTGSKVSGNLQKSYEGFVALNYNTDVEIAADGSTVVELRYDRLYYLLGLDLAGGFGAEPVFARYGSSVSVANPTRPGYRFTGWSPAIPSTMPAGGQTSTAGWTPDGSVNYTIQYWLENANDDGYSFQEFEKGDALAGTPVSGSDRKTYAGFTYNAEKTDKDVIVKGDGSTVVNVYYTRNVYTVTFKGTATVLTCTKEEHTHTYDERTWDWGYKYKGGCYPSDTWSSTRICGKNTHTHSNSNGCFGEQSVTPITAKYGAYIGDQWPGGGWYVSSSGDTAQSYLPVMPLGGKTFYNQLKGDYSYSADYYVEALPGGEGTVVSGKTYTLNHTDKMNSDSTGWNVTDEERYGMEGFECNTSLSAKNGNSYNGSKFYYTRNNYELCFNDQYGSSTVEKLPYEQTLSESQYYKSGYTPAYPSVLEEGAYRFAGWFLDPDGTVAVDWDAKMPAANIMVYAKWEPVTHKVSFSKTNYSEIENIEEVMHGALADDYSTSYDPYKFIGWFYLDENGVEHAFDLSTPVVRDLALYAKWRTDVIVNYTIHYQLADGTPIAPDTVGSALALTTKTFEALTGTALNEGYRTGYFPTVTSHSLMLDPQGTNEFTFVYEPAEKVTYTVRYLEKDTNAVLHEEKVVETYEAIITEKFEVIKGYAADAYQKRLVLSSDASQNVLTFWYVKDTVHAPVQIIHWLQNIEGDGYTEYQSSSQQGTIGVTYTAEWQTIENFHRNEAKSNISGELTKDGLVLNLYYDRDMIPYTFHFVDQLTGNKLADDVTGTARCGATVSQEALNLRNAGYKPASGTPDTRALTVTSDSANEFTFYYIGYFNVVHVRDKGTDVSAAEEIDFTPSIRDNRYSLTARVTDGYLYGGTFSDKDCQTVFGFAEGENGVLFTPKAGATYYIWEVSELYLAPKVFCGWIHTGEGDNVDVTELYFLTPIDRQLYREVGFTMAGLDYASEKDGEKLAYRTITVTYSRNKDRTDLLYLVDGVMQQKVNYTEGDTLGADEGYIGVYKLTDAQFEDFRQNGCTFQAYWVTLDGVKVTGVDQRSCTYNGVGEGRRFEQITVSNNRTGSLCTSVTALATNSMRFADTYTIVNNPESQRHD